VAGGFVTHYGLFWSERDVLWSGKKGSPTQLKGRPKTRLERRGRPSAAEVAQANNYADYVGVYCLYWGGRLIYVGEAGLGDKETTLLSRLKSHRKNHLADRWEEFSWFGCSKAELERTNLSAHDCFAQMEAVLISVTNPGSNKQNGTFANAAQVFQVPDLKAEGDLDTKMERLSTKLDGLEQLIRDLKA
jgi:hypothetical protein